MVCTQERPVTAGASTAARDGEKAPPPAWHGAVAKAVLDGRCADAKRVALQNGDLQAAKLAVDLCVAR
jgi:hypothetical protein